MERGEAEAIYDAGRETCVEFMLEMAQRFEELAERSEREFVAGPQRAEVAVVERGELGLAEALCDGQDGAVKEADFEVGVGPHQLGRSVVVACGQVLDGQLAGLDRIKHLRERLGAEFPSEHVVKLSQNRRGDNAPFRVGLEQRGAALVVGVVGDHRCDQRAGVEDQRNGRGSNSSRLARSLRSLRPVLNAPINENGGCGASSAGARSSAPLTNCDTSTPRSSAACRARFTSLGSASIMFAGGAAMPGFFRRSRRSPVRWRWARSARQVRLGLAHLLAHWPDREAAKPLGSTRPARRNPLARAHPTENAPPGRRGVSGVTTGRRDMYLYICGSVGGRWALMCRGASRWESTAI
jgi:hypothetical protein